VAAAGPDVDRRHRLDRNEFAVQFHLPVAFEHEINLGHLFVIMRARIFLNIHNVKAGDGVL